MDDLGVELNTGGQVEQAGGQQQGEHHHNQGELIKP